MTKLWLAVLVAAPLGAQNGGKLEICRVGRFAQLRRRGDAGHRRGVRQNGAGFYWHLGDFRAIYTFDEDLAPPASLNLPASSLNIITYETTAWNDFIEHQLAPFGDLPIFLTPGNHETIPPATHDSYLLHFADWLDVPVLREQRLKDDPKDHGMRSYYHWMERGVDFIALDNASTDQIDDAQLKWLRAVLARDEASAAVHTIVVGMHAALPGSIGADHSMNDWPQGQVSGRAVYNALWHAESSAGKKVYILASHSHFFMPDVYHTAEWQGKTIPGWIVGTAGAVRYRLPAGAPKEAMTDVYGYLVATVGADGSVAFAFQKLSVDDLLRANRGRLADSLVHWCFDQNRQLTAPR